MGDLISIFEFVIQHNEYLVLLILTLLLLLAFVILLAEYKTKVIYYILHRRNKWWFAFDISSVIVLFVIVKYMNSVLELLGSPETNQSKDPNTWFIYIESFFKNK